MTLQTALQYMAYQSLLNAFIHQLAIKWDLHNWYNFRAHRWMPRDCSLCFFWWLTVAGYIAINIIRWQWVYSPAEFIVFGFPTVSLSLYFFNRPK